MSIELSERQKWDISIMFNNIHRSGLYTLDTPYTEGTELY